MMIRKPFFVVAAVLLTTGAGQAAPISVNVNGRAVSFPGTPPTQVRGSVLVPLRGVFEALGATVRFDAASKTIFASKGSSNIVLPLGAYSATVNGSTQTLSQPAQVVSGTTLVPLRFVAQALGATVQWVAARSTVEITTPESHLSSLPTPGSGPTVGLVPGVYTNTVPPQLTVRVNGRQIGVPVGPNTIVLRKVPGQPATAVALSDIRPGDQVTVQRDSSGTVTSVTASYGEVKGTVKSIGRLASGSHVITLDDGTTVELEKDAPVTMAGRSLPLSEVKAGETVVVRTNPDNNVGFGVAVVTGNNSNPTPPGQNNVAVSVASITYNNSRPLHDVDSLKVTMKGTPGGKASFSVPGLVEDVTMKEISSGVYEGVWPVPKNISVTGASVLGKLTANGQTAPLIQAGTPLRIDSRPPKISDLSPANGATVEDTRPLIYGSLSDGEGLGVNPGKTRLLLDGADVSAQATATPAFFNFRPSTPLASGAHTVRVSVADNAANAQTASWKFTVSGDRVVQSFTSSASAGQAVSADTDLRFTLKARPNGRASFSLGSLAQDVPMRETQPGVYVGDYIVRPGDNIQKTPATARFTSSGGQSVTATLDQSLTIAGGAASKPRILSPDDGANVGETLTVSGTAAPNATVRVSVTYVSKALGGLFAVNGSAGSEEVKADKNGNWKVEGLQLRGNSLLGNSRDTTFTISAATVDASGKTSDASKITVRRG